MFIAARNARLERGEKSAIRTPVSSARSVKVVLLAPNPGSGIAQRLAAMKRARANCEQPTVILAAAGIGKAKNSPLAKIALYAENDSTRFRPLCDEAAGNYVAMNAKLHILEHVRKNGDALPLREEKAVGART